MEESPGWRNTRILAGGILWLEDSFRRNPLDGGIQRFSMEESPGWGNPKILRGGIPWLGKPEDSPWRNPLAEGNLRILHGGIPWMGEYEDPPWRNPLDGGIRGSSMEESPGRGESEDPPWRNPLDEGNPRILHGGIPWTGEYEDPPWRNPLDEGNPRILHGGIPWTRDFLAPVHSQHWEQEGRAAPAPQCSQFPPAAPPSAQQHLGVPRGSSHPGEEQVGMQEARSWGWLCQALSTFSPPVPRL
ncbi:hypothetical protein DUI87_32671 [Hirundo rustica rustica]|uniref:Uncharacterized protein n=1 Tax=Hirundo rustica rustica TaxID=333673 RepID=A0A3M0IWB7_HIRRU|nr:hypothetical protein DUI87_32671 [Hirundo rustica rustica]